MLKHMPTCGVGMQAVLSPTSFFAICKMVYVYVGSLAMKMKSICILNLCIFSKFLMGGRRTVC